MPSAPPPGQPVGPDGPLDSNHLAALGDRGFGVYVHVPFCASRCGYCDFNTYTSDELGPGASRSTYAATAIAEIHRAADLLAGTGVPEVSTVFVGGGTPTLLPSEDLGAILAAIQQRWGLLPDAEVTTEANPDSVTPASLETLRRSGFTRISFGMQSAASHVLQMLERTHTPGRAVAAAHEARAAGFEHVNVDLIYATPGETSDDFVRSLDAAIESGADHVSAYSLIVEDGTRLAGRVRRGEIPMVDDDVAAARYEQADAALRSAGFDWYEVSNWAKPGAECRHNLGYWRGDDWWGVGPGAHSHIAGVRWWNVRHPAAFATAIDAGGWPIEAREVLSADDRRLEDILLRVRLREGFAVDLLNPAGESAARQAVSDGLLRADAYADGRAVLTDRGRLLADAVVRDLVD